MNHPERCDSCASYGVEQNCGHSLDIQTVLDQVVTQPSRDWSDEQVPGMADVVFASGVIVYGTAHHLVVDALRSVKRFLSNQDQFPQI